MTEKSKPIFKRGQLVVSKMALPGAPANTPMIIEKVFRGSKREDYRHQYMTKDNHGKVFYIYESYLG